jgi:hypothetical protein
VTTLVQRQPWRRQVARRQPSREPWALHHKRDVAGRRIAIEHIDHARHAPEIGFGDQRARQSPASDEFNDVREGVVHGHQPSRRLTLDEGSAMTEPDRFLSCTNCGSAYPIDSIFEDDDCYQCGGVLTLRVIPPCTRLASDEAEQ